MTLHQVGCIIFYIIFTLLLFYIIIIIIAGVSVTIWEENTI